MSYKRIEDPEDVVQEYMVSVCKSGWCLYHIFKNRYVYLNFIYFFISLSYKNLILSDIRVCVCGLIIPTKPRGNLIWPTKRRFYRAVFIDIFFS